MSRPPLARLLRLGISIGLLALLFRQGAVDLGMVVAAMRGARPVPLAAAVVLYAVLGSVVRGFRWQALVRALGHRFAVVRATELFLVGTFFNQLLPTGIGGDVVRTLVLAGEGLGRARAASTVIVDRAVGILMLLAVGLLALILAWDRAVPQVAALLLAAILAGVGGSLALLSAHHWRARAESIPLVGRLAAAGAVVRFVDSFAEYSPRALAVSAGWTTVFTALLIGANALLARALGIWQADLLDWAQLVPLVALSSLLPSVGGWGVREWTYVGLLGTLVPPVPAHLATAMSVLFGGMNLLLAAVGGVLSAWGDGVISLIETGDAS